MMTATIAQTDRLRGALLGLVWGDALGCPVEGWRQGEIATHYDEYAELPTDYPGSVASLPSKKRQRLRPLGLHSDDGQQAMALIGACLEGWSPWAWARWLVAGKERQAWRGTGRNFDAAVRALARGCAPERAGSSSAGMGAAMRVGPLGALYRDDRAALADAAMESSLVTHGDIRAGALAFAVAHSVAELCVGTSPEEVVAGLPEAVRAVEAEWLTERAVWTIDRDAKHLISDGLAALFRGADPTPHKLRGRISRLAKPHLARGFTKAHPNQGFVLLGGLHGLATGLLSEAAPDEALAEIIRQGFDTDTVAAIAGAVLGARYGTRWIPTDRIYDRGRVERYADALVSRDEPPETMDEFFARERALTSEEKAFQARWAT